jgi:hypothetical protein
LRVVLYDRRKTKGSPRQAASSQRWQPVKLTQAAEEMGIQYENTHDALADAIIMLTLVERIASSI